MKLFFIYWLPPLLWMVFIFPTNDALTFSTTSYIIVPLLKWLFPTADTVQINSLHILARKFMHFFEYALLAVLLLRAFRGRKRDWSWNWILYAGIITIGYSSLDETLQTIIPSRTGSFSDWMIDSAGAVCALLIVTALASVKMRKEKRRALRAQC